MLVQNIKSILVITVIVLFSGCLGDTSNESVWDVVEARNEQYYGNKNNRLTDKKSLVYKHGKKEFSIKNNSTASAGGINWPFGDKKQKNDLKLNASYRPVKNITYAPYDEENRDRLKLDLFISKNTTNKKPLILFFHGGGFVYGQKENPIINKYAKDMARAGYVTASVNYRYLRFDSSKALADLAIDNDEHVKKTIFKSLQDARAAIGYLVDHADEYEIDVNNIYVAGFSSGGIIALNSIIMDDTEAQSYFKEQYSGALDALATRSLNDGYQIKGIISLAGALLRTSDLDDDAPPILLMHGTNDLILDTGRHLPFDKYMRTYQFDLPGFEYAIGGTVSKQNEENTEIILFGINVTAVAPKWITEALRLLFTFKLSGSEEIYETIKGTSYNDKCTYLQFVDAPHCFMRATERGGFNEAYNRSIVEINDFVNYYSN